MPKAYPQEFREAVVRIARQGKLAYAQVARTFGIYETCVSSGVREADNRGWEAVWDHRRGCRGAARGARGAQEDPDPGAGERDIAPGRDLSWSRHPPRLMYPLVVALAAQGIPVVRT